MIKTRKEEEITEMMKLNLMKYSKHLDITLFGMQQRASLLGIQGSKEVILVYVWM